MSNSDPASQPITYKKKTTAFIEHVKDLQDQGLECDPIKILMEIALGKKKGADGRYRDIVGSYDESGQPVMLDAMVRVKAASELCSYMYPKRKSVEVSGDRSAPIVFAVQPDLAMAAAEPSQLPSPGPDPVKKLTEGVILEG